MTFDVFLAFATFCFVSSVTPGPNNLMLLTSGANFGVKRTLPHWLGIGIGFTGMIIMVGLGLITFFDAYPWIYTGLKILSVVFLIYLAWKIATAAPAKSQGVSGDPMTFLQAAAFQWANPKAWAMALTAVTVYAPSQSSFAIVGTAVMFGAINLPSCGVWMFVGQRLKRFLSDPARLRGFNIVMALLLLASLYPILLPGRA